MLILLCIKFQKILMTECRDMYKNHKKCPHKWDFYPICDPPRFFFKNRALSLLYPYGAQTSCKKLERFNEQFRRYLKTNGRTNGPTRAITMDPISKPGVQNDWVQSKCISHTCYEYLPSSLKKNLKKIDNFWQNLPNSGYLLQKRDFLKIMQVQIFSWNMMLESWNLV